MQHSAEGLRRLLLGTFAIGVVGTTAELLLLGHVDGWLQLIPLPLLALAVVLLAVHLRRSGSAARGAFEALMWIFLICAPLGVALHFRGNVEFEREMYPDMSGFELIRKTMTGATPVLAPGTMALLGLVGIAYLRVDESRHMIGDSR